jgi:hypothetical protein
MAFCCTGTAELHLTTTTTTPHGQFGVSREAYVYSSPDRRDIYLLDGKLFDSESPAADDKERLSADLKGRKQKHEGWPNVYQATVSATIKWSQGFTAKPKSCLLARLMLAEQVELLSKLDGAKSKLDYPFLSDSLSRPKKDR